MTMHGQKGDCRVKLPLGTWSESSGPTAVHALLTVGEGAIDCNGGAPVAVNWERSH